MLEAAHRELWCPMVRDTGGPDGTYWNRPNAHQGTRCIGSDCAMWRWAPTFVTRANVTREFVHVDLDTSGESKTHGYCGLGGPTNAR
jgi:hypothetical protein